MSNRRNNRSNAELAAAGLKECPECKICWSHSGFNRHYRPCKQRSEERRRAALRQEEHKRTIPSASAAQSIYSKLKLEHSHAVYGWDVPQLLDSTGGDLGPTSNAAPTDNISPDSPSLPENSDFTQDIGQGSDGDKPESHANENSIKVISHFRVNRCHESQAILKPRAINRSRFLHGEIAPWAPFRSCADFRFARNCLRSDLSKSEIDEFISIHHLSGDSAVSFTSFQDLKDTEARAAHLLTPFSYVPFRVPYQSGKKTLECELGVYIKSLKDWMLELVLDPKLQHHLHFDAVQRFCWMDGKWVRFFDEPWTADNWAKMQASLPTDGLPINIHLYADKAIASSFGTKRLYPVIARLCNLPREIRNSNGLGGGRVVALLPVISERPAGLAESGFAEYKCKVWHAAMGQLLETISVEARIGDAVELESHLALGLATKMWRMFPAISIISADYEEQIIIAYLRSIFCMKPCVRCLVPDTKLFNLLVKIVMQDPASLLGLLQEAEKLHLTNAREHLKDQGYRPVKNAFLSLGPRTNIFEALSYDTLHTDDLGRWGKHLWPLLKEELDMEPPAVREEFNCRIDSVPPWPELDHFMPALEMDFSDGQKYENLLKAKVVLHGAAGLPVRFVPLVSLIRLQAELRVLASLEVHTELTLVHGKELVKRFHAVSLECSKIYKKHFNFPKMHLLTHLFDDIESKGVSSNFSTKPGERMHATLRQAYLSSSRKKEAADAEVLRKTHALAVYELMQMEIDEYSSSPTNDWDKTPNSQATEANVLHVQLGSTSNKLTLGILEAQHADDPAFKQLGRRVCKFLSSCEPSVSTKSSTVIKIHTFKMLKVQYESKVDWCLHRDILRCSPLVYNKERYDCVLVESDEGVVPARLLMLFKCQPEAGSLTSLALVLYLDAVHRSIGPMEQAMGFRRFRQQSRDKAELILVRSIVRGALLVPVAQGSPDYLANDLLDPDMYIRFLDYTAKNIF